MSNSVNEYTRIINSISLNETAKETLFKKVSENLTVNKNDMKKQIVAASVAAVVLAFGVSHFVRIGSKIR